MWTKVDFTKMPLLENHSSLQLSDCVQGWISLMRDEVIPTLFP